jgi:hypothetical protein
MKNAFERRVKSKDEGSEMSEGGDGEDEVVKFG